MIKPNTNITYKNNNRNITTSPTNTNNSGEILRHIVYSVLVITRALAHSVCGATNSARETIGYVTDTRKYSYPIMYTNSYYIRNTEIKFSKQSICDNERNSCKSHQLLVDNLSPGSIETSIILYEISG